MANGDNGNGRTSRIEKVNQLTRAIITLSMCAGVIYGFVISRLISAEVFVPLASGILTWWFVRDQATASSKEAAEMIKTPPPTTTVAAPNDKGATP